MYTMLVGIFLMIVFMTRYIRLLQNIISRQVMIICECVILSLLIMPLVYASHCVTYFQYLVTDYPSLITFLHCGPFLDRT